MYVSTNYDFALNPGIFRYSYLSITCVAVVVPVLAHGVCAVF